MASLWKSPKGVALTRLPGGRGQRKLAAQDFPPSTENVSFMLRKYYNMLLANFEQVYFFGADLGELISTVAVEEPAPIPVHAQPEPEASSSSSFLKGSTVVGDIEDVINDIYVVTVNVGNEKLKGVDWWQGQPTGQLPEHSGRDSVGSAAAEKAQSDKI